MKTKLNIALKIIILVLISTAFLFYILATATDYWQKTKYNVSLHSIGVFTSYSDKSTSGDDLYHYTSSHSGLWKGCAVLNNKKICASLRVQYAWIRSVRAFMALAIISIAVVFVFVIAAFFRLDLVFKFPGVMSLISALFGLLALAVYTGKSGVPADNYQLTSKFSWSFIIGWTGWVLNMIAGILCFIVPDVFDKMQTNKVQL